MVADGGNGTVYICICSSDKCKMGSSWKVDAALVIFRKFSHVILPVGPFGAIQPYEKG